jgi:hypothetical protein
VKILQRFPWTRLINCFFNAHLNYRSLPITVNSNNLNCVFCSIFLLFIILIDKIPQIQLFPLYWFVLLLPFSVVWLCTSSFAHSLVSINLCIKGIFLSCLLLLVVRSLIFSPTIDAINWRKLVSKCTQDGTNTLDSTFILSTAINEQTKHSCIALNSTVH